MIAVLATLLWLLEIRAVSVLTTNGGIEVCNTRYEWDESSLYGIMVTQC